MKNSQVQFLFVCLVSILAANTVVAFEDHAAHEHGQANLMLVQEMDELQIVFQSPATDIVGFEHQPKSAEQKNKLDAAVALLRNAEKLIQINDQAQCSLEHTLIKSGLLGDADKGSHEEHESHDDHHKHHDDEAHSEFEVEYHFECENAKALKEIKLGLFKFFSSIDQIETQIIDQSGQRLQELDHSNASIKF